MQARLETRRFPAAAFAIVFAVLTVFILSAGGGYAIKSLSAPAAQKAPAAVQQVVQVGPQSDLTRVLPRDTTPNSWGGPQSNLPVQQAGDTSFDTCTKLVHKVC